MKISNLLKLFPVLALMFMMNVPNALAGGTNRGENTSAEPGDKATTTEEVTDPAHDRRKGTTNKTDANKTNKMKKPTTEDEMDSGTSGTGTGGSSTGGADSGTGGTGTDSSGGRY